MVPCGPEWSRLKDPAVVSALTLLSGAADDKPGLQPQYCSECGLRFNMKGIGLEQHYEVCSRQFGVPPASSR